MVPNLDIITLDWPNGLINGLGATVDGNPVSGAVTVPTIGTWMTTNTDQPATATCQCIKAPCNCANTNPVIDLSSLTTTAAATTPSLKDYITKAEDWIKANKMLAAGVAVVVIILLMGLNKKR